MAPKEKAVINLILGYFVLILIGCSQTDQIEQKIVHQIIDHGYWTSTSNDNKRYIFYNDGKYYCCYYETNPITKEFEPKIICNCIPIYRRGKYVKCLGNGLVIRYSNEETQVFEMYANDADECYFQPKDCTQITGRFHFKDSKGRVFSTGCYKNHLFEGWFMNFDTLGNVTKMAKYRNDTLIQKHIFPSRR